MWKDLLTSEASIAVVVFVLGILYKLIEKSKTAKKWQLDKAYSFVAAGVEQTYKDYVRNIKAAKADGKLTDDERREARERAKEYAIAYAKEDGFDLLKTIGKDILPLLIEKFVSKAKSGVVKNLPPVLSEVWRSGYAQVMPELEATDSVLTTNIKDGN